MLKQRFLTVLIILPLVVVAVWFSEPLPWFTILVAIWGVLAALEFYSMVKTPKVLPLTGFGLLWTLLFILSPHFDYAYLNQLLLTSAVVLPSVWLLVRRQKEGAFLSWAWTIAGILFIGWLLSHLVALRGLDSGRDWVFFALFTTFASDSTAFLTGRVWGRHHLAPTISPGKTWEGAIGGVLGAIIVGLLLVKLLNLPLSYAQALPLALAVSVFGQAGDLVESLFKRNMGVKDSGRAMPGHGGFLDRIDSIVFTGVVVYYYVILFRG